jgi:hypothetical protein
MLHTMSRWEELIGRARADTLRARLCEAAATAHRRNGERFDPNLGDEALLYGLNTTFNARHVARQLIEEAKLDGVAVGEQGRIWWLEIQREDGSAVCVYFYKARPGARTIRDLCLDDAEIKRELSTTNGQQMALFNRSGGDGNVELLNLVVAHWGDPDTGLQKLEVGAPYLEDREIMWDWHEPFDRGAAAGTAGAPAAPGPLGDDGGGYEGLRLLPKEAQTAGESDGPAAIAEQEQATSEFEALKLRDDVETGESGTGVGEESS